MKDLFNEYKYKVGYPLCLALSALVSYFSIKSAMSTTATGKGPNVTLHVLAFFLAIGLVALAIYCRQKSLRK